MDNVIEFLPLGEREEVEGMRKSLLTVTDEPHAMTRVAFMAERIADIINEINEISVQDRQSLLWHLSLIRELAAPTELRKPEVQSVQVAPIESGDDVEPERKIKPGCTLPRFDRDPPGAA
jgi:hypothetical protein